MTRDVIGKEVRASDDPGQTVGRLASLIIDEPSGVTQYAVIDRGGLLGWDRHHVIVPFHLLKFTGQWDLPTLTISTFKLEYAPYISDQDVEALLRDPEWRRSVADYFGVALAGGAPMTDQGSVSASSQAAPSTGSSAEVGQAAAGPTATHSSNTMISSGTESLSPAAAAQGQTIAQHLCGVCHTLNTGGGTRVGPNLYGVVGRPIASLSGYNYSSALKGHNGVWDMATLDNFLKDPRGYASGTYMTFPGIASERDRQAVITYLATLKTKAGALQ